MSSELPNWIPPGIDIKQPNAARVYDYLLGGGCNFEQDREFADRLMQTLPELESAARHNRAFLGRAVRFCVANGVDQFLDIGSGIPTVGNVHEIAQTTAPDCRVVYVDREPIAVAHSELMLESNGRAGVVRADLLDPDAVFNSGPVERLLDFERPIAVLMVAVLHFLPNATDPYQAVARYVDAMAPGSYLVISHAANTGLRRTRDGWRLFGEYGTPGGGRTKEQLLAFLTGTDLVEPGIVWTAQWRPDSPEDVGDHPELSLVYAAVGRKP